MKRVIIIGGGFAGLAVARGLSTAARRSEIEVTVIDRQEYQSFTPLLYEVATGYGRGDNLITDAELSAAARVDLLAATTRHQARLVIGEVIKVDRARKMVCLASGRELPYDALAMSPGSVADCHLVAGAVEHGVTLKSVSDAIKVRDRILSAAKSAQANGQMVNVVVAGAGATGVELAGELKRMADHHLADKDGASVVKVTLVESRQRPLAQLSPAASIATAKRLMKIGVELRVGTCVEIVRADSVRLSPRAPKAGDQPDSLICAVPTTESMEMSCDLFVWTAGICGSPAAAAWGFTVDPRNRIVVSATLELPELPGIFAVGDAVSVIDPSTNNPFPWNAQAAMRQGGLAAKNILKFLSGKSEREQLSFSGFPTVVTAGGKWGVLTFGQLTISGFLAWCARKFADAKYFFTALPFGVALKLWWRGLRIFSQND